MPTCAQLLQSLRAGEYDSRLSALYALDSAREGLDAARDRAMAVVERFAGQFGSDRGQAALFSAPGRTEIGGNHTDHQHGHVLCGSVDLDTLACASPNGTSVVRVISEGYPVLEVDLSDLDIRPQEANSSPALVRGVAARLTALGYRPAGFDAYMTSTVLPGSGLSSSAAYEVLLGNIFNHFFCGGALDPIVIAKAGQYAENIYFGKPCGLMDQVGSSVGGSVAIDFANPDEPKVERVEYDFSKSGHALCIVDTGSCHADLTDDYAQIPREMTAVAACFGKTCLREVPEEHFQQAIPALRSRCGDRAVVRAIHYYEEDRRAIDEVQALKSGDFSRFLSLVNASGLSSSLHLQNIWSPACPRQQAVTIALAVGRGLLDSEGAIRVHGGGFAGTIQAFVPYHRLDAFHRGMEGVLGKGMCRVIHIRSQGGCVIAP